MLPEMALECTTQAPVARAPARACVVGVTGWLGSLLATALTSSGVAEVVSGVSRRAAGGVHDVVGTGVPVFGDLETALGVTCDVVVDATSPEAATRHVGLTADAALSTVLTSVDGATARMVREQWQRRNNGRALVVAPNLSAGFALFRRDVLTLSAVDATGTVLLHDLAGPHVRQPMNATGELAAALMSRGVPVEVRSTRDPSAVSEIRARITLRHEALQLACRCSDGAAYAAGVCRVVRAVRDHAGVFVCPTWGMDDEV